MHSLRDVDCKKFLMKKKNCFWDLLPFVPFYLLYLFTFLYHSQYLPFYFCCGSSDSIEQKARKSHELFSKYLLKVIWIIL